MNENELQLRTAYWDDLAARGSFKSFIRDIHGLDFSAWESAGFWDDAYRPFSFFVGGEVVASVCLYLLDAVIEGRATKVAQISGVGTRPEWRRRGLNRQLTEMALEWGRARFEGLFLFSDTDAIPFYESCGFEPQAEYLETLVVRPAPSRRGVVSLDCTAEGNLARIYQRAERRAPVSNRFGVLNAKLVMFHVMYRLERCVYEIPDLDCIVLMERMPDRLRLLDILAERIPSFEELLPFITDEGLRAIEFHFHSDRLRTDGVLTTPLVGNHCFVRGRFPLARPVFPYTSRA